MRNQDRRIERFRQDAKFSQLVRLIENLFYQDAGITYEEVLDAAYVARVRYIEMNPNILTLKEHEARREKL
jgi:hypothetical protein